MQCTRMCKSANPYQNLAPMGFLHSARGEIKMQDKTATYQSNNGLIQQQSVIVKDKCLWAMSQCPNRKTLASLNICLFLPLEVGVAHRCASHKQVSHLSLKQIKKLSWWESGKSSWVSTVSQASQVQTFLLLSKYQVNSFKIQMICPTFLFPVTQRPHHSHHLFHCNVHPELSTWIWSSSLWSLLGMSRLACFNVCLQSVLEIALA